MAVSEEHIAPSNLQGRILRQARNQQKQAASLLFDKKTRGDMFLRNVALWTIIRCNSKDRNLHSHCSDNLNFALHKDLYILPTNSSKI
jgi:hypothetical protein